MIRTKKATSRLMRVLSAVTAALLFSATVFASGALAGLAGEQYTIEIKNNGETIKLANAPFVENGTVYLPLREMLHLAGIGDETITYDRGYVQFFVYSETPIEYRGEQYDFWVNRVLIDSRYAYIQGHSYGSTENAELLRAPILKQDTTYVPYDLFEKLKNQGVFDTLEVTAVCNNGAAQPIAGILYRNDELNITLELPLQWAGNYQVQTDENSVTFLHTASYNKYGKDASILFSIIATGNQTADEGSVLFRDAQYTYRCVTPAAVQLPSGAEAEEYEKMAADIEWIKNSFRTIVKFS